MMRNSVFVVLSAFMLLTKSVLAHNEDKPGPHGGYIRMPGAFHTELVLKKKFLQLYLVDFDFKNPTTSNSSLAAKWISDNTEIDLDCRAEGNKFVCDIPKSFSPKKGSLVFTAKREGMSGGLAQYDLPLPSFPKPKTNQVRGNDSEHNAHH